MPRADGSPCVTVFDFGISKAAVVGPDAPVQLLTGRLAFQGSTGVKAPAIAVPIAATVGGSAPPTAFGTGYVSAPTIGATPAAQAQSAAHGYTPPGQVMTPPGYGAAPAPMNAPMGAHYGGFPAQPVAPPPPEKPPMHPLHTALLLMLAILVGSFNGCISCVYVIERNGQDQNQIQRQAAPAASADPNPAPSP